MEIRPIPDCLMATELPNEEFKRYSEELMGVEEHKRRLLTHMEVCLNSPRFSSWLRHRNVKSTPRFRKRVLFMGPPGTGKTMLAQSSANDYATFNKTKMYFVELGSVRGKFVGESSKNIDRACDYVEYLAEESIVFWFLDEFDSVGVSRSAEQMHDDVRAMVNTLIKRMNRMTSPRIFIMAASNLEKHVDYAMKRRFDFILYFQRPSLEQRFELFEHLTDGWSIPGHDIFKVSKKSERYTQDDVTRAVNFAVEDAFSNNEPLSLKHLLKSIEHIKPTEEYS